MKFLYSNINSIKSHKQDIDTIITVYRPDIVGFNETKRPQQQEADYDIDTDQIIFKNNLHIPRDTSSTGQIKFQGTSVFSRDTTYKIKFAGSPADCEIIAFEYKVGKLLNVNCRHYHCYLSPSCSDQKSKDFFSNLITDINDNTKPNQHVIISGDLNALDNRIFPCKNGNKRGKLLYNMLIGEPIYPNGPQCKFRFINHVKKATRTQGNTAHLLDPFITSHNFTLPVKIEHLDSLSDHDMIMVYVDEDPEDDQVKPQKQTLRIYNYEEANVAEIAIELNKLAAGFYYDMKNKFIDLNCEHRMRKDDWKKLTDWKLKQIKKYEQRPNKMYKDVYFKQKKIEILISELQHNLRELYNKYTPHKTYEVEDIEDAYCIFPAPLKREFKKKTKMFDQLRSKGIDPKTDQKYLKLKADCKKNSTLEKHGLVNF